MTKLTTVFAALALCTSAASCGNDDDKSNGGGGGKFSAGVSGSTVVGTLDQASINKVCMNLKSFVTTNYVPEFCRIQGGLVAAGKLYASSQGMATDAQLQAACTTGYNACVANPTEVTKDFDDCGSPDPTCTATVSEYEACVNDTPAAIKTAFAPFPACDKVTSAALVSLASAMEPEVVEPASCKIVDMKCP